MVLIAQARVVTERAGRYLDQLCRHVNKVAETQPEMQAQIEWSDNDGVISFGWGGRCTLRADSGALSLRVEAPDEERLRLVQARVGERLERFGRNDHITVTWTSLQGATDAPPRESARHDGGGEIHD